MLPTSHWLSYFRANLADPGDLPWHDSYRLTDAERETILPSIQQFQLGEGSDGKGLLRRARLWALRHSDPDLVETVQAFIREEQRHSAWLKAFMDRQGMPLKSGHWADTIFRAARSAAGLELCLRVLVTAEIIAVPYYTALRNATRSPLLRALCERILRDEDRHLSFQSSMFARFDRRRAPGRNAAVLQSHRWFLSVTAEVVWRTHTAVLEAGGYGRDSFRAECLALFADRFDRAKITAPGKPYAMAARD